MSFGPCLSVLFRPRRGSITTWSRRKSPYTRARLRLHLEALEGRVVPATHTWTGLAGDGLWSTAGNWDVGAPTAAEGASAAEDVKLIFPAVASETTTQDVANLIVDQIQFQAGRYSIQVDQTLTLRQGVDSNHPTQQQISVLAGASSTISEGTITTFLDPSRGGQDADLEVAGTLTISSVLAGGNGNSGYDKSGAGTLILWGDNTFTGGFSVRSGTLVAGNAAALGPSSGGTEIIEGATLDVSGLTFTGNITGSGEVAVGSGFTTLSGTNSYTGTTTVSGGFLHVDGTQGGSAVLLKNGGILGGRGTIGAITTTAGTTVSPGLLTATSPITLTANGDANLTGSTFGLVVYPGARVSDELIVRQGTVTLTGATLDVRSGTGTGAPVGQSITLVDNQGPNPIVGTFTGLPSDATVSIGRQDFRISYVGGDGNDVVITALTGSPSPIIPTPTRPAPTPTEPAPTHIHLTAVLFTKKVGKKKATFIRIISSAGGTPKELRSPFQKPAYRGITVLAKDTNGDGSDDSVVVTGKKGKKTRTVNIRIG
jgi:autotransporter-associated beta strand protein